MGLKINLVGFKKLIELGCRLIWILLMPNVCSCPFTLVSKSKIFYYLMIKKILFLILYKRDITIRINLYKLYILSFHFSILPTKQSERKLKYFLSFQFSIISPFSIPHFFISSVKWTLILLNNKVKYHSLIKSSDKYFLLKSNKVYDNDLVVIILLKATRISNSLNQ